MTDDLQGFFRNRPPTVAEPLLGRTVLLVEDSRFGCEAIRLISLRSGARIRRADCIAAAERHLSTYSPTIAVIDLGLPDGDGLTLIRRLAAAQPRIPALIATSGDDARRDEALAAGADAFLPKPLVRIAAFQEAVLACLPRDLHPTGLRAVTAEVVLPDDLALRDDLAHVAELLQGPQSGVRTDYLSTFLKGVAKAADDDALGRAAAGLRDGSTDVKTMLALVQSRLKTPAEV